MTPAENFKDIMEQDYETDYDRKGCDVFDGLAIMRQYVNNDLIVAADHDIVYSVEIQELIDGGINLGDVVQLGKLGWHVSEFDTLAHYV